MRPDLDPLFKLRQRLSQILIGKPKALDLLLTALLSSGHILIEDLPGVGKTTLAKSLSQLFEASFARIQCTPDLFPSDILGTSIYHQGKGDFLWHPGPIFSNFILADELNRATPRTQSALLEAMGEGKISSDGAVHKLPHPFMVIATQNPLEYTGTYPLPENQLDRFMLRINLGYPDFESEEKILSTPTLHYSQPKLEPVLSSQVLLELQHKRSQVMMDSSLKKYLLTIVRKTRTHPEIFLGGSPRSSIALYTSSQAFALLEGRDYVIPDDIKTLVPAVLGHRIILKEGKPSSLAEDQKNPATKLLEKILDEVPVPV